MVSDRPESPEEERRKWLFGETGEIDETLNAPGAEETEDPSAAGKEDLELDATADLGPWPTEESESTRDEIRDTAPDKPQWELPDPADEPAYESPPEPAPREPAEPAMKPSFEDDLMPDKSEGYQEPSTEAGAEAAMPAAEAGAPAEEAPKLPSWILQAEEEARRKAQPAGAPAKPLSQAELKSAPTDDWSPGTAEKAAKKAAEMLAAKAAPLSALPKAEKAMAAPTPVSAAIEVKPLDLEEALETASEEQVLERITQARQLRLMTRIDEMLDKIYDRFSAETSKDTLEEVLKLLKAARHTLIENPRDFDRAEYYTYRAKMLIDRFAAVRQESYRWTGLILLVYELILAVVVFFAWLKSHSLAASLASQGVPGWAVAPWTTMLASAMGAILGALWALVEHVSIKQDFNKQHRMWYLASPVKGLILGGILYFMIHAGTLAMGISTPDSAGGSLLEPDWFLLTLAVLIGFQQNVALDLFERFVKLIRPAKDDQTASPIIEES